MPLGPQFGSGLSTNFDDAEAWNLPRVCAMFDEPYLARYARGAGGLFRLFEMQRVSDLPVGEMNASATSETLKSSEIASDSQPERCPWCGAHSVLVFCPRCKSWVCSGQLRRTPDGECFKCRLSCGNTAIVIDTDRDYEVSRNSPVVYGQRQDFSQTTSAALPQIRKPRALQ